MCLETRLPLSQLPRDGDSRAHLNKSASLLEHHASSPILLEEKPPVEHHSLLLSPGVGMCVPIREASMPSGEDGLGLQGEPDRWVVHSEIAGQLPKRSWLPFLFSCLQSLFCVLLVFSSLFSWFMEFICSLICLKTEVYKNTKGLLCLKYRCSFTHVELYPDKPVVSGNAFNAVHMFTGECNHQQSTQSVSPSYKETWPPVAVCTCLPKHAPWSLCFGKR